MTAQVSTQLLSISKAAKNLKVSVNTLRNWDNEGKLKPILTAGGQRRYTTTQLNEYKKSRKSTHTTKLLIPTKRAFVGPPPSQQTLKPIPLYQQSWFKRSTATLGILLIFLGIKDSLTFRLNVASTQGQLLARSVHETLASFISDQEAFKEHIAYAEPEDISVFSGTKNLQTLGIYDVSLEPEIFQVNLPSQFTGDIDAQNQVLDLTGGEIIAPNVIYSLTAGTGINITPGISTQDLIIESTAVGGVTSLQGTDGAITLVAGTGITIDGLTISSSVTDTDTDTDTVLTESEVEAFIYDADNTLSTAWTVDFGGSDGTFNLSSTGNFIIQDNGVDFVTFTGSSTVEFADGSLLDLSAITHDDSGIQGLKLPQTTSLTAMTGGGEGYIAWDTDDNQVQVFNGTSWTDIATGIATLWTDNTTYIAPDNTTLLAIFDNGGLILGDPTTAVSGGARTFRVYDSTDTDYIQISHNGTDANFDFSGTTDLNIDANLIIDTGHNVGIGTDAPSELLDVAGSINLSNYLKIGGVVILSVDGTENTFLGEDIGTSNTGSQNTFVGASAGSANESGSNNTFIGYQAGTANTSGGNNTYLGGEAGSTNTTGSNNVFLGFQAGTNETGSDKLYIDPSNTSSPLIWGDFNLNYLNFNGNVGIGDTSPLAAFVVGVDTDITSVGANDAYIQNDIEIDGELYIGDEALTTTILGNRTYTEDNYVTDLQSFTASINALDQQLFDVTTGTGGLWARASGVLSPNTTNDVIAATTSATTALTLTQTGAFNALLVQDEAGDTTPFVIQQDGNVGIGTTTTSQKLDVVGEIELNQYLYFANAGDEYLRWDTSNFLLSDDFLPDTADSLNLGAATAEWNALYVGDDAGIFLGLEQDIQIYYDETTSDALTFTDGSNTLAQLKSVSSVGNLFITGGISTFDTTVTDGYGEFTGLCLGNGTNCITDWNDAAIGHWARSSEGVISPKVQNDVVAATTSATTALTITQTGAFDIVRFEDEADDTTPFTIDQNGDITTGGDISFVNGETLTNDVDGILELSDGGSTLAQFFDAGSVGNLFITGGISTFNTTISDGYGEFTGLCLGDGETNCIVDWNDAAIGHWDRTSQGVISPKVQNDVIAATTSATVALTITQTGAFNALLVQDEAGDTTPFVIDEDGNVSIGGTLDVNGNDLILDADADTYIDSSLDDVIRIVVNGDFELYLSDTILGPNVAEGLQLGSTTQEFEALYLGDNAGILFGLEQDIQIYYDETTSDALTFTDGSNTLAQLKSVSSVGNLFITGGISTFDTSVTDGYGEFTGLCLGNGGTNCITDWYWTRTAGVISPKTQDDVIAATTSATTALTITQTGAFDIVRFEDEASDTTPFVIDQSGNVGIGDSTPASALVVGSDTAAGFANGAGDVYVQNDLEVDGEIYIGNEALSGTILGDRTYTSDFNVTDSQSFTASVDALDLAIGSRLYTEDNYVTDGQSLTASVDALDQEINDLAIGASGLWTRTSGVLSPGTLNNVVAATSSATTVLTLTQTGAFNALLVQDEAGDTTPFIIDENGNVGIGLTSTTDKLAVNGTTALGDGGTTNYAAFNATGDLTFNGTADTITGPGAGGLTLTNTGGQLQIITATSGELDLTSAGLLDINAGANLDIDVTGTLDMLSTSTFSIDGTGNSNLSVTSGNLTLSTLTSGYLDLISAQAAGGTTTEAISLSATNDLGASDEVLQVSDGGGDLFTILGDGNVGIGTAVPGQKLDVVGEIELNQFVYFGNASTEFLRWNTADFVLSDDLLPSAADSLNLGSATAEWNAIYLGDNDGVQFGLDQDFRLFYDETTDDRLELTDGTTTWVSVSATAGTTIAQTEANNALALTIDSEESTGTQNVFAIITDSGSDENTVFTVNAQGDLTIDGNLVLDDGGSITEAGGTAAITLDGSGEITKIGQDTPNTNEFLMWDGSKVVWANVGGDTGTTVLQPEYAGSIISADGSNNSGTMTSDNAGSGDNWMNYYEWNSSQITLQDYDIYIRFTLPDDFSSWATGTDVAIVFDFVTETTTASDNQMDISVYLESSATADTTDNDNVSGTAATWTTTGIDDSALTDCNAAGETCVIVIKTQSKDSNYIRVGDITLQYNR